MAIIAHREQEPNRSDPTGSNLPPKTLDFAKKRDLLGTMRFWDEVGGEVVLQDSRSNLALRKRTSGWRWAVVKSIGGKMHRTTLAKFDRDDKVQDLRDAAEETVVQIKSGDHVSTTEQSKRAGRRYSIQDTTMAEILDDYFKDGSLRENTRKAYEQAINNLIPGLGTMAAAKVDAKLVRDAWHEFTTKPKKNGKLRSPATAAAHIRALRTLWNAWFFKMQEADPSVVLSNPFKAGTMVSHNRSVMPANKAKEGRLDIGQHQPFFEALCYYRDKAIKRHLPPTAWNAVEAIYLTGLRKNEILRMTWDEVDLEGGYIVIGPERLKAGNKRPESLRRPITRRLAEIIADQASHSKSEFVFESPLHAGKPLESVRKNLEEQIPAMTGIRVGCHDLRRTWITASYVAGIDDTCRKILTAHANADMSAYYAGRTSATMLGLIGTAAQQVEDLLINLATEASR